MDKNTRLSLQQQNAILSPPLGNCNRLIAQQLYLIHTSLSPSIVNTQPPTPIVTILQKFLFILNRIKLLKELSWLSLLETVIIHCIYLFLTINRKLPRHHCYRLWFLTERWLVTLFCFSLSSEKQKTYEHVNSKQYTQIILKDLHVHVPYLAIYK